MVVSMPRKGLVSTEPRDMVRVQLKPNDVRSYTRDEAEEMIAAGQAEFIVGEQAAEDEGDAGEKAPRVRSQRAAPNKARSTRSAPSKPPPAAPPAETKGSEPPSGGTDPAASETKPE